MLMACSKANDGPEAREEITAGSSIYYVDTFKVYATDYKGNNRKLLFDEDIKSENNYITDICIMPGSGKIVYGYITSYLNPEVIKITNADGSGKKVIKTIPVGTNLNFVKGIPNNRIYFGTGVRSGNNVINKFYVMNDDGTNEKELTGLNSFAGVQTEQVSSQGKGLIASGGYFVKIKDDAFSELESFNVLTNEKISDMEGGLAISPDATKLAFVVRTSVANKYDVRVKDISTRGTSSVVAYTFTLPTAGSSSTFNTPVNLCWADNGKKLIFSYGKFTTPKGAATDNSSIHLIDPANSKVTNWTFGGDGYLRVLTD